MPASPAAFMSYSRFDDHHNHGYLTAFRERLSGEVRAQWGSEFKIFQDITDIGWGADWRATLNEALGSATFLIPIVSPSFFKSDVCREEVARFDAHEQNLAYGGLILPLYFIKTPEFEDFEQYEQDPIVSALYKRQCADWRELRHMSIDEARVEKEICALARHITNIIELNPEGKNSPGASRDHSGHAQMSGTIAEELVTQPALHPISEIGSQDGEGEPDRIESFGRTSTGILRAVAPLADPTAPWPELAEALEQTEFEPVEWRIFSVRTRKLRHILSQEFPPYPVRAAEVSSTIEALSWAIDSATVRNANTAQIRSSCELAERLRIILINLITKTR